MKPLMPPTPFIALLGVLVFWGGILVAERRYPAEFDWRYMTLSTLISPRRNPAGYVWGGQRTRPKFVVCVLLGNGAGMALGRECGRPASGHLVVGVGKPLY